MQEFYKRVIDENINISKKCKQESVSFETKRKNVPEENFDKHRFHCYAMQNKAEKLLQINYKEIDINTLDNYGWSALMMSACAGPEAVRISISRKHTIESRCKSRN
uniref:Uncharacterized protein n=1 Tax=Glossina brevipalpis TaxID=37001 RepID=A0A1A9X2S8_9MUSC